MEKILEIAQLIVGRATPKMPLEDIEVYLDKIEVTYRGGIYTLKSVSQCISENPSSLVDLQLDQSSLDNIEEAILVRLTRTSQKMKYSFVPRKPKSLGISRQL